VAGDEAFYNGQGSAWHLLADFVPDCTAASDRQSLERVTEALSASGLPPAEVARIGKAVLQALQRATQREERDQHDPAISLRVWMSSASAEPLLQPGPDAERVDQSKRWGWGFFLLERQEDDPQPLYAGSQRVIEVCVYQERAPAKKGGSRDKLDRSRSV
jgi:hypothetical protein